jgi:uncharacterized membrane protein (Fun14 family)
MNEFKTAILKRLNDGSGRLVSLTQGAVIAAITNYLLKKNITLDPMVLDLVSLLVGGAVMWLVDSAVILIQTEGVKKIQDALPSNVVSDGVPGDVTVSAVKRAVSDQTS